MNTKFVLRFTYWNMSLSQYSKIGKYKIKSTYASNYSIRSS